METSERGSKKEGKKNANKVKKKNTNTVPIDNRRHLQTCDYRKPKSLNVLKIRDMNMHTLSLKRNEEDSKLNEKQNATTIS